MGSLDSHVGQPRPYEVELKSEDSIVKATWCRTEVTTSKSEFARNVLHFDIHSISPNRVANTKHDRGTVDPGIWWITSAAVASEPLKVDAPCKALTFIANIVAGNAEVGRLSFILPAEDGYIVRGDFIEDMFRTCAFVAKAETFVSTGQHCSVPNNAHSATGELAYDLLSLLQQAVGVVAASHGTKAQAIDDALDERLWWPWTVPNPFKPSRIAVIGEARRESMARIFYATTRGCDVSVVVLDRPGHWMEDPTGTGARLREHFIPFEVSTLDDLPERIFDTIRNLPYQIHGVLTTIEAYLPGVARAAEMLGLPTIPSQIYRRSTDKFETRQLWPAPTTIKVDNLEMFLSEFGARSEPLQYPLIVKPTHGHGSLGASRVCSDDELVDALRFAFSSLQKQNDKLKLEVGAARVIIETYCEGPEVDVNLVLWDGELLFAEVSDQFPCDADLGGTDSPEPGVMGWVGALTPSALPANEIEILKRDVLEITRKLGVRSGVVHAEARVHDSAVEWRIDEDGKYELRPRADARAAASPKTFLLEVNVRPPGNPVLLTSTSAYGIDYYALQLMQITGDEARFRALAHGYRNKPLDHYVWVPLRRFSPADGGRMPQDLGFAKHGLDAFHVYDWRLWRSGDDVPPYAQVPHPGLGFVLLRSRNSRLEVLEKTAIATRDMCIQLD